MDPEDLVDGRSYYAERPSDGGTCFPASKEKQQAKQLWPLLPLSQSSKATVPINFLC